jgi:ferritin heavy chain
MASLVRQNYHTESEAAINKQIYIELHASYVYQSMSLYFDRDDVALRGFHKFFHKRSDEQRDRADKLMKYQNKRGGRVMLQQVDKPDKDTWGTGLDAMKSALSMEMTLNQSLLDLHKVANSRQDPSLSDWLETEFLREQTHIIKKISEHVTNLKRVGSGIGEYVFDKETLDHE